MFELNGTLILFIALFLVFIVLLNEVMLKPVGRIIETRNGLAQADYEQARAYTQEGEAILTAYQKHIHEVRLQAQKVIHDAQDSARADRDKQLKQVQVDGVLKVESMQAELSAQRQTLLADLIEPELEIVKDIISKLLGESHGITLGRSDVERALEEAK